MARAFQPPHWTPLRLRIVLAAVTLLPVIAPARAELVVYTAELIRTMEPALPTATAVAVEDGLIVAVGSEGANGRGFARLYASGVGEDELLATWVHPKVVWSVRLSPDGQMLAAAGYDCALTVYDCLSNYFMRETIDDVECTGYVSGGFLIYFLFLY